MSTISANLDSGGLASNSRQRFSARSFEPHPLFRNPHVTTVAAAYWPRDFSGLPPATERLFEVKPETRLLAKCHWPESRRRHGTLVLQDDPLVPISSFRNSGIAENRFVTLVTPEHGGHCAFISSEGRNERFWAEQCVLEFCTSQSVP